MNSFQYNNMSLGLMIAAVACLFQFKDNVASILFVAALNYKQMELYHALPFFSYLLGRCTLCSTRSKGFRKLVTVGLTVIGTFFVLWLPFLLHPRAGNQSLQVFRIIIIGKLCCLNPLHFTISTQYRLILYFSSRSNKCLIDYFLLVEVCLKIKLLTFGVR